MVKKRFLLFFILMASSGELSAGEAAEIPPITIYGEKESQTKDVTLSSTVVPLTSYQNRVVGLPEVLSEQAGIHLTRFGGLEDFSSISIRGSSPQEVQLFLDGIPLNSAESGSVDLSPVLIDFLESIEIYRGGSPLDYGQTPSAGTVYLNSGKIMPGRKRGASVGYGSFNTWKGHVFYSETKSNWGFLAGTSVTRTDGDFSFLDDNGTPANSNDDARVKRQNNRSQTVYPFFKIFYDFDKKTRFEAVSHFIRKDAGVPGLSTNQSDTASLDTTAWLASLLIKRDSFFHKNLSLENRINIRLTKIQYSDPFGEVGLGGAQDNDDDTSLFGDQVSLKWYADPHHTLTGLLIYQVERFRPEDFAATPSQGGPSLRQQWNVGAGDEMDLANHRLFLTPNVLLSNVYNQINNNDPSFLTPATFANNRAHHALSAKMGIKGVPARWLTLSANGGRGFRFPTFNELFGDRGGVVGNPLLEPEVSLNWDAGVSVARRSSLVARHSINESQVTSHESPSRFFNDLCLSINYFERRTDNLIQFEQNAGFARAENIGESLIRGVEMELATEFLQHLLLSANYTFQHAKDQQTNLFLVGRPSHEVNARGELFGKIPLLKKGNIFISANWMDNVYLDPLNTRLVRSRLLLNSGFSIKPHQRWTFSFEAKNLTNNQIVDVVGFPLPGRSFFGKAAFNY